MRKTPKRVSSQSWSSRAVVIDFRSPIRSVETSDVSGDERCGCRHRLRRPEPEVRITSDESALPNPGGGHGARTTTLQQSAAARAVARPRRALLLLGACTKSVSVVAFGAVIISVGAMVWAVIAGLIVGGMIVGHSHTPVVASLLH